MARTDKSNQKDIRENISKLANVETLVADFEFTLTIENVPDRVKAMAKSALPINREMQDRIKQTIFRAIFKRTSDMNAAEIGAFFNDIAHLFPEKGK